MNHLSRNRARVNSDLVLSPNGFGFRSNTGEVYRLNPTAVDVLKKLGEGEDESEIAHHLHLTYGISLQRARQDVAALYGTLGKPATFTHQ